MIATNTRALLLIMTEIHQRINEWPDSKKEIIENFYDLIRYEAPEILVCSKYDLYQHIECPYNVINLKALNIQAALEYEIGLKPNTIRNPFTKAITKYYKKTKACQQYIEFVNYSYENFDFGSELNIETAMNYVHALLEHGDLPKPEISGTSKQITDIYHQLKHNFKPIEIALLAEVLKGIDKKSKLKTSLSLSGTERDALIAIIHSDNVIQTKWD